MKLSITSDDSGQLHLAGCLDIYAAGSARDALISLLHQKTEPQVDLHDVHECDAAGIQVLCSAAKTAAAAGSKLEFLRPSAAMNSCCEKLGCHPALLS